MSEKKSLLEIVIMPVVIAVIAIVGARKYEEYRNDSMEARIDALVAELGSGDRIAASDQLVLIYSSGDSARRMKVVQALLRTIKGDGHPSGSGFNIDVTYVLSQVRPRWLCSAEQRRELEALQGYKDKGTDASPFNTRLKEALGNCDPVGAP